MSKFVKKLMGSSAAEKQREEIAEDFFGESSERAFDPIDRKNPATPSDFKESQTNRDSAKTTPSAATSKAKTSSTTTAGKKTAAKQPVKKSTPYVPPAPITAIVQEGSSGGVAAAASGSSSRKDKPSSSSSDRAASEPAKSSTKDRKSSSSTPHASSGDKVRRSSASGGGKKPSDPDKPAKRSSATAAAKAASADKPTKDHKDANKGSTATSTAKESPDKKKEVPGKKASKMTTKKREKTVFNELDTPEPSSESGMRFDELYRLKGVLGTGAFSTVREGFHRSNSGQSYAVKCVNRKKLSEEDEAALLDEVAILKEMKHIHIIRLYDFFTEPSTYYLVMERMRGGELFDRIVAKAYYNEKEARDTCKILLEAIDHCHSHRVAHRDLKPENLLLLSENDDSAVKIADFGFAKKVYEPCSLTTQCGTPGYVAPEILEGTPYDERADMWSVGVILYILLGGYPPFIESTQRDLFRKIRKGEYEFHEEYWGTVSAEAKNLISTLLTVDPVARLTAKEALGNLWITAGDAALAGRDLGANLEKFKAFNARRKFKAVVQTIMAVNKLNFMGNQLNLEALKDRPADEDI